MTCLPVWKASLVDFEESHSWPGTSVSLCTPVVGCQSQTLPLLYRATVCSRQTSRLPRPLHSLGDRQFSQTSEPCDLWCSPSGWRRGTPGIATFLRGSVRPCPSPCVSCVHPTGIPYQGHPMSFCIHRVEPQTWVKLTITLFRRYECNLVIVVVKFELSLVRATVFCLLVHSFLWFGRQLDVILKI